MAHIEWLHNGRLAREQVGGKGASLSELMAAGFQVPPGFCVTADGYRYFAEAWGRGEVQLPEALRDEIAEAYDELCRQGFEACAVRSSAVSEDGAAASYAGLYETYLNVRGVSEVLACVQKCYASLWSERAVQYRSMQGGDDANEAMAVVVMGLVPSETSGIAFTAHPVTGDRNQVVINASWGLGEAIVSGRVTPDMFVVQKDSGRLVEREIYPKELAIYSDPAGNGGTIEHRLAGTQASAPCLSDDLACEVARLAARVEAHYGSPQDIEWGLADGRLYLLQSRPITTL